MPLQKSISFDQDGRRESGYIMSVASFYQELVGDSSIKGSSQVKG